MICPKLLLLLHLTPYFSTVKSQPHGYVDKFCFVLLFFLPDLLEYYVVWCTNLTLCVTHPNSGRQGLKMRHKTQKEKGEIMYTGNIDGSLNVVILLLPSFLEFKSISKVIHKVIHLGVVFESEVKASWWMGLGNYKLTDIDRMTFYSSEYYLLLGNG